MSKILSYMSRKKEIIKQIEALQSEAQNMMNETAIPVDKRIQKAADIYKYAERMADGNGVEDKEIESLWSDSSKFFYDYGMYKEALARYTRLIELCESLYGQEDPIIAMAYHGIGDVYRNLCNFSSAIDYQTKALEIQKNVLGEKHLATAETYNDLGLVYLFQGDYNHASGYILKAKAIREELVDDNHPDLAESYANVGLISSQTDDPADALENYQKALEIYERALGSEDRKTGLAYHGVGFSYFHLDDISKALDYCSKAIAIYENAIGSEHPETAVIYLGMGYIYDGMDDLSKSMEYFTKSNEIFVKAFGEESIYTAASYTAIGWTKYRMGEYQEALELSEKGLNINEKLFGFINPNTAEAYMGMGALHRLLADNVKAYEYYINALEIFKKCPSSDFINKKIEEMETEIKALEEKEEETIGSRDLLLETLTKIGCQYEIDSEDNISFAYQGENFIATATNGNFYVHLWDLYWSHVELYDVDGLSRLKQAINYANVNCATMTVYTIDEEGKTADVHCKSSFPFVPQMPEIEAYLRNELAGFFNAHRLVESEMAKLREQELSSSDEEGRGN